MSEMTKTPMKLEAGQTYLDRKGRAWGPLVRREGVWSWPFAAPGTNETWAEDGSSGIWGEGPRDMDLVAHAPTPAPAPLSAADHARGLLERHLPSGVEWWMLRDALCGMSGSEGLTTFQRLNARIAADMVAALTQESPHAE